MFDWLVALGYKCYVVKEGNCVNKCLWYVIAGFVLNYLLATVALGWPMLYDYAMKSITGA